MKLSKARQSLNEAETVRSIVKSLRDNSLKHQLTTTARVERGWDFICLIKIINSLFSILTYLLRTHFFVAIKMFF